nr:hypothetical protein [uncultured bacterium]
MKTDRLVRIYIPVERRQHTPAAREFDKRDVIGRHARRRDEAQLRTPGK